MIIGYLDASNKNIAINEQKQIIEKYVGDSKLAIDVFSSDDMTKLAASLQTSGHTIILANVVGLGNSLNAIKDNLKSFIAKGLTVISIKENLTIEPNQRATWLIEGMELSIDIRNSMVSTITKKALDEKKAQGYKLGRDYGRKNKRYIWEGKEEEIKNKLMSGLTRKQIAQEVGISIISLYNYLKQNPALKQQIIGDKNA